VAADYSIKLRWQNYSSKVQIVLSDTQVPVYLFAVQDPLGSSVSFISDSGDASSRRHFGLWGRLVEDTGVGKVSNAADETIASADLIHMNSRVYDAVIGAFTSPDRFITAGSLLGMQRYAYVHNNPLNAIDPTGWNVVYASERTERLFRARFTEPLSATSHERFVGEAQLRDSFGRFIDRVQQDRGIHLAIDNNRRGDFEMELSVDGAVDCAYGRHN